jgi:hypothetical protein
MGLFELFSYILQKFEFEKSDPWLHNTTVNFNKETTNNTNGKEILWHQSFIALFLHLAYESFEK